MIEVLQPVDTPPELVSLGRLSEAVGVSAHTAVRMLGHASIRPTFRLNGTEYFPADAIQTVRLMAEAESKEAKR